MPSTRPCCGHASDRGDRPVTIRLPIDDPYADQKTHLLHVVADALALQSRARTRRLRPRTRSSGSPPTWRHRGAVHVAARAVAGGDARRGGERRARESRPWAGPSARRSCSPTPAGSIERLAEVNESRSKRRSRHRAADRRLLPVLAARADAIDEEIAATFGPLDAGSVTRRYVATPLGWERGVLAADRGAAASGLAARVIASGHGRSGRRQLAIRAPARRVAVTGSPDAVRPSRARPRSSSPVTSGTSIVTRPTRTQSSASISPRKPHRCDAARPGRRHRHGGGERLAQIADDVDVERQRSARAGPTPAARRTRRSPAGRPRRPPSTRPSAGARGRAPTPRSSASRRRARRSRTRRSAGT